MRRGLRTVLGLGALTSLALAVACGAPQPAATPAAGTPAAAATKAPASTPAVKADTPVAKAQPPAQPTGRVVIGIPGVSPNMRPLELGAPTRVHTYAIFDTLAYVNEKGVLTGRLAESWRLLPDNLTWEFKLRPGLLYHDNSPVDAASIKWSLDWAKDPANASPLLTRAATFDTVTAVDPLTIQLRTRNPSPLVPRDIESFPISSMAFALSTTPVGQRWQNEAAGSGAYRLQEFRGDISATLVPSGRPTPQTPDGAKVAELVYRAIPEASTRQAALRNREIDIAFGLEVDQALSLRREGNQLLSIPIGQTVGFTGNILQEGPQNDPRVRQAAFMAINKQEMVDGIYQGLTQPAQQIAAPGANGHQEGFQLPYRYDVAGARQLLAQAGFPNGFQSKMHVLASSAPFVTAGTAVAGYLEQIGIRLEIEQMDGPRYTELFTRGGMNPWYVNTWTHSTLDLDAAINWFLSDITTAPVRYRNPRFDQALKASKVELNEQRRTQLLQEAQRILLTEEPVTTPLFFNPYFWVANQRINNFKLLPSSKIDVTGLFVTQ